MRVPLDGGRTAIVGVRYGEEQLHQLRRPDLFIYRNFPHKTTTIRITVQSAEDEALGDLDGKSFCSPLDQFVKTMGRKLALRRLFDKDPNHRLLSKSDRRRICRRLLTKYFDDERLGARLIRKGWARLPDGCWINDTTGAAAEDIDAASAMQAAFELERAAFERKQNFAHVS